MRILQARILEWLAIPSSRGSSQPRDQAQVSRITGGMDFFLPSEPPGKPSYTYIYILFHIFSMMVYYRVLTIVPYTIQWELVVYPLYIE